MPAHPCCLPSWISTHGISCGAASSTLGSAGSASPAYVSLWRTLTKVLHFAIGKPIAYHGKFAVKRTAKSTLANYGKLSRAKHRGKKRSPASHKRMPNNGIFTFHGVKASHSLPPYFSLQINKKKTANLLLFAKRC